MSTAVRGVEIPCDRKLRLGTLLGPEGSAALRVDSLRDDSRRTASTSDVLADVRGEIESHPRPHLENCTVDASIFVVKLLRAHGGCLGTRSRRRT